MKRHSLAKIFCLAALGTALTVAATNAADEIKPAEVTKAIAILMPTEGNDVKGTVSFIKTADGVKVEGKITGLTPGKHGFHIHEFGDLSSPDGKSLGGHFNPEGHQHGGLDAKMRHAGDFGNIEADDQGVATVDFVDKAISLSGENSILGRGVVVHAKADDLKSQPSGDAGARVAVASIGVAAGKE
ncbi:MAG: superoxide dismutase family protein [Chthoniobacteraceae bacterium]